MAGKINITALDQIKDAIKNKENFVLQGGAGSGKTHSLIETLKFLCKEQNNPSIACITYTNVAKNEISKRIEILADHKIQVSTIHDFLWTIIQNYQVNIMDSLLALIKDDKIKYNPRDDDPKELTKEHLIQQTISYKDYRKFSQGTISHDDILKISAYMITNYPLLRKIVTDTFPYILIDEYQDTSKQIMPVIMEQFIENKIIIGLFGDTSQAIYQTGIGDVKNYIDSGKIKEIIKQDNYRSSRKVINFINQLRKDGLTQKTSREKTKQTDGTIKLFYSNTSPTLTDIQDKIQKYTKQDKIKTLNLTHNGNLSFLNIHADLHKMLKPGEPEENLFINYLFKIAKLLNDYNNKIYNSLYTSSYQINTMADKQKLSDIFEEISSEDITIDQTVQKIITNDIIPEDDNTINWIKNNQDEYNKCKNLCFQNIISYHEYKENNTLFSTMHGVKGDEYENVLVILLNWKWYLYNFTNIQANKNDKILKRTQKLLYVATSRAKENLYLYMPNKHEEAFKQIESIIKTENVVNLDDIVD